MTSLNLFLKKLFRTVFVLTALLAFAGNVNAYEGEGLAQGPVDARVSIIVFADFSCGYCAKANAILDELLKIYPDDIVLIFKNYPLNRSDSVMLSHEAAYEAGVQGKFWKMHDWLYANQNDISYSTVESEARNLGLNMKQFNAAINAHIHKKQIELNIAEGRALRVRVTPTYYIDGYKLEGVQTLSTFQQIIDNKLKERM